MSENPSTPPSRPTTLGEAMYGSGGPAAEPQGPNDIDSGKAVPTPSQQQPRAADPRAVPPNAQPRPEAAKPPGGEAEGEKTLGEAMYGKAPEPFDATKLAVPEGFEADPALMGEFGEAAKALNLNQEGANKLVALHAKAVQAQQPQHDRAAEEWRKQTEAAYTTEQLAEIRTDFNAAIGNDGDAQEFKRLLVWSGLGNHPAAIRVISRLLGRR
jgi:hypothetical protein